MKSLINKILLILSIFVIAVIIGNKVNSMFYYASEDQIHYAYQTLKSEENFDLFCIENKAHLADGETVRFKSHSIKIEGKTAKLFYYDNDEAKWIEQDSFTHTINAKLARILAEPNVGYNVGTYDNVIISYKQYAIWNTINEWIKATPNKGVDWGLSPLIAETNDLPNGESPINHFNMTYEQIEKGEELLRTATEYANNIDKVQEGIIDNTGELTFERIGDKIKVGPFNWIFDGSISNLKINGTYDLDINVVSNEDFYIEVPYTFKGINTITGNLTTDEVYTADMQLLEVLAAGINGADAQNLMYADASSKPQTMEFSFEPNKLFSGSLRVIKVVEGNENLKLNGVGFKIRVAGTEDYLIKNSDGTISYNGTEDNCTEFVTGIDGEYGEISIDEIFAGRYIAYETKNPNYGYEVDTNKQTVIEINPGEEVNQSIGNKQKYVRLSGYIWQDIHTGKLNIRNDLYKDDQYDDKDTAFNGIKVKLVDKQGNIIEDTISTELGLYDEIDGGEYIFNDVLVEELSNYHIEFEYDGLIYQSVGINLDKNNGSKATDREPRKILDQNFKDIQYNGKDGVSVNNGTYNITYNRTEDHKSSILDSSACTLNANTADAEFDILSKFVPGNTEIKYINLGLYKRPQTDLALVQDLENVKLGVNGYWHIYNYGNRSFKEDSGSWNVGVKFKDTNIGSYTRAVYKSDIEYQNEDKNKELQVYFTYKIAIRNEATYLANVSKVVDYYDGRYELVAAGMSLNKDNKTIEQTVNYEVQKPYNEKYNKAIINVDTTIKSAESNYLYLQFKLDRTAVIDIINNRETLYNMAEIHTYNVYKNENRETIAALDIDSVPGNAEIGNIQTYEDDTDSAPPVKLELKNPRELAGTVFVDTTTGELKTGEIREGNGTFENGEKTVAGVKVTLHELNNSIKDIEAITDENGNYTISGFIPGQYKVTYTWGNKTYKVQDYKGTIYNQDRKQYDKYWYRDNVDTRYTDALDDYNERKQIDNQMAKITNGTIRDIVDKAYEGENPSGIITTMNSTTPTMEFLVEYDSTETSSIGDEVKFTVKNVDFGIVERARQQLDMEKRVSAFKIVLTDGTTLIDATVNPDGTVNGVKNYLTYMAATETNGNAFKGYIKAEVDNEKIQGSTLFLTYEVKAINNSEVDYMSEGYYKYGSKYNGNKGDIVTLRPTAVVDYLDKRLAFDASKNADWKQISFEELKNLNAMKVGDTEYINNKLLLYTEATVKDLKPTETVSVNLNVSTILTTSNDISFDNDVETVVIEKPTENKNADLIIKDHIGSIVRYFPTASAAQAQVVPSTGDNREYIIPTIVGIVSLVVLGGGVFIIKKKVIDNK